MSGFISINRQILEWEWYTDSSVKSLFIHCLLKANFKDNSWRGIDIQRGSFITSYASLANELKMSVQQVRTALKKLEKTNEISVESTNKNTLVTVVKYDVYQDNKSKTNKPTTNQQQTDNKQITTTNKENNDNKEINNIYSLYPSKCVVKQSSTGKSKKVNEEQIKRLLKDYSPEQLMDIITRYVRECKQSETYMKNFKTFLNNLPDYNLTDINVLDRSEHMTKGYCITLLKVPEMLKQVLDKGYTEEQIKKWAI